MSLAAPVKHLAVRWIILLCTLMLPQVAFSFWHEVSSDGVDIVSELDKDGTSQVAQAVADLKAALRRLFPTMPQKASPPVTLLVVHRSQSAAGIPFVCSDCSGVTIPGETATHIIDGTRYEGDVSSSVVALHEITHQVLRQTYRGMLPVWLDEGMAELLSTVRRDKSGKLIIGIAPMERWITLQHETWMPLGTLLTLRRGSKELRSEHTTAAFYAQAWLLVHYAHLVKREYWPQIEAYINLLRSGASDQAALAQAFPEGIAALERELRTYARQKRFVAATIEVPLTTVPAPQKISDAEGVRRYLEVLTNSFRLRHKAPPDVFVEIVRRNLDDFPTDPQLPLLLATVYMDSGKADLARPLLERNCRQPLGSADVALLCAGVRLDEGTYAKDPSAPAALQAITAARSYCETAQQLVPDDLRAWACLADTYIYAPGDSAAVRTRLEQFLADTPSNYYIAMQLAQLYAPVEPDRARRYAQYVLRVAHDPDERQRAQDLLQEIEKQLAIQSPTPADKP